MEAVEWVTMREAADMLAPIGVGRETTRRLLLAGLAGESLRRGNGTLHRRDRVAELRASPLVGSPDGPGDCRTTFVARLPTYPVPPVEERWEAARGPWRISALGRLRLRTDIERDGFVPLVATLGGFIVLGADIVEVGPVAESATAPTAGRGRSPRGRLELRPAGAWYEAWQGHRLPSPGRHQWWVWPDGLWGGTTDAAAGCRPVGD